MAVQNFKRREMGIRNIEGNYIRSSDFNTDAMSGTVAAICDHKAIILMKQSKCGRNGGNKQAIICLSHCQTGIFLFAAEEFL